jgi:2-polyprenyl-6-hydroxyphenyl methylase/3-demethylubiquinone-9 3-methyltransferase
MANIRWRIAQFAERNWWKIYLKKKPVTDYLAWKKKYWQNLLAQCAPEIKISKDKVMLDAGCGPAGMFIGLPENCTCTAFDPLIDAYEKDLNHFSKSNYPHIHFLNCGIENFTTNKKYDIIFCMNAINHVQDIDAAYAILANALAPNGQLVISIDAHNHSFFKKIFAALPGDILHPHQYNLQEYENFITNSGLQMQKTLHLKHEFFFDHYLQIAIKKP